MAPLTGHPPAERGGWWHEYVCPAHGVELEHIGFETGEFPAGGVPCVHGCRVDSPAVRGAWTVLAHHWWARRIRLLSYEGGGGELLTAYARLYLELTKTGEHEQAQGWMQRGRLFHQALTDAVWGVPIAHSILNLASAGAASAELVETLPMLDDMFAGARRARDAMVAQGKFSSNYTAWFNALGTTAGQAAAAVRGEAWDGAGEWLTGEFGQFAHLEIATGEDGWEWEASTYYHGFVLRAYLLSLRGIDPASVPDRLEAMIAALAGIATDGGILPALHDGLYLRVPLALEWLEIAALARQFTSAVDLSSVAQRAQAEVGPEYDGLERKLIGWFAGPPRAGARSPRPITGSYAVVRVGGIHAILDHGPHGGSHGHHDKLALYLYGATTPWQPDPGQVPYGHAEWRRHYQSVAAHPTIRIDGLEPAEATGVLTQNGTSVTAEVEGWYEGVRATRQLIPGDGYLVDIIRVTADREREIVLQFRPDVELTVEVEPDGVRTTWGGAETLYAFHVGHGSADTAGEERSDSVPVPVTRPGPGPADDPQRVRTWVDWTVVGTSATFRSVYATAPIDFEKVIGDV
ncbi:heparinase II/III domain-containing protein [Kribbella solani]|uniref:heparinase II/III domain-containing protein n=1 Tax=Kribbella solani TaxID=236067 RepID=UPI0029B1E674|nr:heparinase II/III family protein [Kribbella solani]MDX2971670.1 heparinase II/III family protein [Kribbella solani]